MSFPFSYGKSRNAGKLPDAAFFQKKFFPLLINRIQSTEVMQYAVSNNKLHFKGAICRFIWNGWNIFNGLSKGWIKIDRKGDYIYVSYRLYFFEFLVISLLFTIIPVIYWNDTQWSPVILAIIWLIFYGGNMMLTSIRFNHWIKKSLKKYYITEIQNIVNG